MILKNSRLFDEDFNLVKADLSVSEGKIRKILPVLKGEETIDLNNCLITPGFVDIHIHGCAGADTCDGTRTALAAMAEHLSRHGVTSFCPTTMTAPLPQIQTALEAIRDCMKHPPEGAAVRGANMEGPYISARRLGAQKAEYVRRPEWHEFEKLYEDCGGIIKLVDVAPECKGGMEFVNRVSRFCRVSLAHTEADYEQAQESFRNGVTHVTHLFNAMSGFSHRSPGAVGAAFDNGEVRAELICDGFHIHPAVLRAAFRILGEDRTIAISDSMRAAGLPDGISELGGQKVTVKNGCARLADGTIAGSTTNLADEVKKLISFGIPVRQVVKSVTINPAAAIGAESEIGSIRVGKRADLVVLDNSWNVMLVLKAGEIIFNASEKTAVL